MDLADVEDKKDQPFSWEEADAFVFMEHSLSGDQVYVSKDKVGDESRFFADGLEVKITIYNGNAIGVDLPPSVVLQITSSEPGVKGDTASGATKPATLSTGAVVNVPLFIKEGEWVKVDTSSGQYSASTSKRSASDPQSEANVTICLLKDTDADRCERISDSERKGGLVVEVVSRADLKHWAETKSTARGSAAVEEAVVERYAEFRKSGPVTRNKEVHCTVAGTTKNIVPLS